MRQTNPVALLLAVIAIVVFFAVGSLFPYTGSGDRRPELAAIFNLPEDATWVAFDAPVGRWGLRHAEAIVAFNAEQWEAYTAKLDDPAAWNPSGRTFNGLVIPDPVSDEALRWHDAEWAWIVPEFACFWVDWGSFHTKEIDGKPNVWDTRATRSFCWAVVDDGTPRVVPCRGNKHSPKGLKLYARAKLDAEHRRVFAFIE